MLQKDFEFWVCHDFFDTIFYQVEETMTYCSIIEQELPGFVAASERGQVISRSRLRVRERFVLRVRQRIARRLMRDDYVAECRMTRS